MSQPKRCNLNIRLQPLEGSLLADVVKWFNEMPKSEKNQKISQILLMTCIPLAKAELGAEREEVERCYWEFEDWFYQHRFIVRERLKIREKSNWEGNLTTRVAEPIVPRQQEKEAKVEVTSSSTQLFGDAKVENAGSIFGSM